MSQFIFLPQLAFFAFLFLNRDLSKSSICTILQKKAVMASEKWNLRGSPVIKFDFVSAS